MEQAPKSSGFTSRLEAMQKKIYRDKPDEEMLESESTLLPKKKFGVKTDWDIPAEETKSEKKPLTSSFLFKTFLFSVVFFILALGVAAYLFFYGFNTISSHNIEMKIQGPSIVKAGWDKPSSNNYKQQQGPSWFRFCNFFLSGRNLKCSWPG